jgi:hypothetical protein
MVRCSLPDHDAFWKVVVPPRSDWCEIRARLALNWRTRNHVGTLGGGEPARGSGPHQHGDADPRSRAGAAERVGQGVAATGADAPLGW